MAFFPTPHLGFKAGSFRTPDSLLGLDELSAGCVRIDFNKRISTAWSLRHNTVCVPSSRSLPGFSIDRYRSAARYTAWYGEPPTWNPFRKVRSKSQYHTGADEEAGVHRGVGHSETCLTPTAETDRMKQTEKDYPSPVHASTMPPGSAGKTGPSLGPGLDHPGYHSTPGTSETIMADDAGNDNHPRKRKKGLLARFGKKKKNDEVERTTTSNSKKNKQKFTFVGQLKATVLNSWVNVLLVAVPVGIALNYAHVNPVIIFVVNFIAIIPLAGLLSYATEEIALRTGETIGGLLNASFGNAVELIVSVIALVKREVLIVQTSLIGSILSNLLLVMGMSFFFGGLNRMEQFFNVTVAQTASSLLALAVGSLIIPTAFHSWSSAGNRGITELSRGTAVLLLLVYGAYLFFQLKSHSEMYNKPSQKVEKRRTKVEDGDAMKGIAQIGAGLSATMGGQSAQETPVHELNEAEEPQLSIWVAVFTLGASTALVAICAEFMVDSIDALTNQGGISKTFVGLILLPIVGNAAEHATAVTVACKDKMDLAIGVAVGSSMQIALLVIPFVVVLGWIMRIEEMTLYFDGFQIAVLFVAVLLVNYLIQDGKSHWLEGVLLMTLYLIIAIAAWFYPAVGEVV